MNAEAGEVCARRGEQLGHHDERAGLDQPPLVPERRMTHDSARTQRPESGATSSWWACKASRRGPSSSIAAASRIGWVKRLQFGA